MGLVFSKRRALHGVLLFFSGVVLFFLIRHAQYQYRRMVIAGV